MKKLIALDIECLPNYFLVSVKGVESGKVLNFEAYGEKSSLSKMDIDKLKSVLRSRTSFGFNSNKYDMPMIAYALTGARCDQLHKLSVKIIEKNTPEWMTMRDLGIETKARRRALQALAALGLIELRRHGQQTYRARLLYEAPGRRPVTSIRSSNRRASFQNHDVADNALHESATTPSVRRDGP